MFWLPNPESGGATSQPSVVFTELVSPMPVHLLIPAFTLQDHVIPQPRSYYRWGGTAGPDHWLEAQHVWEVKCADLSISPVHKAATSLVS